MRISINIYKYLYIISYCKYHSHYIANPRQSTSCKALLVYFAKVRRCEEENTLDSNGNNVFNRTALHATPSVAADEIVAEPTLKAFNYRRLTTPADFIPIVTPITLR